MMNQITNTTFFANISRSFTANRCRRAANAFRKQQQQNRLNALHKKIDEEIVSEITSAAKNGSRCMSLFVKNYEWRNTAKYLRKMGFKVSDSFVKTRKKQEENKNSDTKYMVVRW